MSNSHSVRVKDLVHELVSRDIPEKLWHYTSVQGFQGIISSGSIYATDVRFLNDTEEFVHARKIADEVARAAVESGDYNFPLRANLLWLVQQIFKSHFLDPDIAQFFVMSFSESEDDLSQWRGYSRGTYGVSVSFDLRAFRPGSKDDSGVTLAPCVYQEEEKMALVDDALQHFVRVSQSKWSEAARAFLAKHLSAGIRPNLEQIADFTNPYFQSDEYQAQLQSGLNEARKRFFRLSGLLKHRSFHHEREWRLVLPLSPGKDKSDLANPIRFRSTDASLIPYIAFPIGVFSLSATGEQSTPFLPVNDVILGPGASKEALSAAQEFLRSQSINVIPRRSDVPYRQS